MLLVAAMPCQYSRFDATIVALFGKAGAALNYMRLIVGISGASGAIYGVRLLQVLQQQKDIETHLILSEAAKINIAVETEFSAADVKDMADVVYSNKDIAATISESA